MNIIEQAAKRIEELQRAGVDTPWVAAGFREDEVPSFLSQGSVAANEATVPPSKPAQVLAVADKKSVRLKKPLASAAKVPTREVALDVKKLALEGFLVPGRERSQIEEEFRVIKRPLLKNIRGESATPVERPNLIMVTSALPGEGKTFTAINLALSMAVELDHTVLLVDADVLRPAVLARLGLQKAAGLMDILISQEQTLADVLLKTNLPKLSILPAGDQYANSTELLASSVMENLLKELTEVYPDRIIIFDAPPILPSTESRVLATHMGQVVVVVEADRTPQSSVVQAFAALEPCPVVMAVLNKSRHRKSHSAYGYYAV